MPRYLIIALLVGMTLFLTACGGVSDEEFEAVQQELETEQGMVQDLKAQIAEAEATPASLAVVEANIKAVNAGDVRALVATYADDIVFSFGPLLGGAFETTTGLAEVLEDDLNSIAGYLQITLSNTSASGNIVRGGFSLIDDETADLGPVSGTFEAVVAAGKIKTFTATLGEESQALIQELFGPPTPPPPQAGEVIFTAFDTDDGFRFRGPDSLPAGWTTLRLSSESQAPHHMQLIKLPEGMTMEDHNF